jgi:AcrR family transcriptional regulator
MVALMPTRRATPEPLELKEACVRAAHEFIAEHGVERLSLRDVARRLGVSHQAPYKHYPSRDHLLAEVIRRCFRDFAAYLDARPARADAREDLAALGQRYLAYAASHPVAYRLMFGTPWPGPAAEVGVVADAVHAFDVLRGVLARIHGSDRAARRRVDLDAMFIWSNMHGLASIAQADVMHHLGLAPQVAQGTAAHVMEMMSLAMDAQARAGPPARARSRRGAV